jgi:O-antigen ligase
MSVTAADATHVRSGGPTFTRRDQAFVAVGTIAYVLSTVKYQTRDALSTDTGAQALVEVFWMGIACVAAAAPLLRRGALLPRISPPVVGLLLFAALTSVSAAFSYWPPLSLVKSCFLLGAILVAVWSCSVRAPADVLHYYYWSVCAVLVLAVCMGIVSHQSLFVVDPYSGRQRLFLLAWHPNSTADLAAMALLIGRLLPRRPHWGAQAFLFCIVALTGARAVGIVLLLVLVPSWLWLARTNRRKIGTVAAATFVAACVVWVVIVFGVPVEKLPIRERMASFYGEYFTEDAASLNGRTEVWKSSSPLLAQALVFGYGLDGARAALFDDFAWAGHSHNAFFEIVLAAGLPGLTAVLVAWGLALARGWRLRPELRPLFLSVHAYLFLSGFADPNLLALQYMPLFLIVCLDRLVRTESARLAMPERRAA